MFGINLSLLQLLPSSAFLRTQKLKSGPTDDEWIDDGL